MGSWNYVRNNRICWSRAGSGGPARRLGYAGVRGYDSAGIAVVGRRGNTSVHKRVGKLSNLETALNGAMPEGSLGIGHTRWATHGGPSNFNAHPHTDCSNEVVVVHNGIVENYQELKRELIDRGHVFESQTDSECIPHMIEDGLAMGLSLEDAFGVVAPRIKGASAVVAFSTRDPGKIVGLRLGNAGGIVVGRNHDGVFLSSDLPALLPHTRSVSYLNAGEMVVLNCDGATFASLDGRRIDKGVTKVTQSAQSASKGDHDFFMHRGDPRAARRNRKRAWRSSHIRRHVRKSVRTRPDRISRKLR